MADTDTKPVCPGYRFYSLDIVHALGVTELIVFGSFYEGIGVLLVMKTSIKEL